MNCKFPFCEKPIESKELGYCATHAFGFRKSQREEIKNEGKKRKRIAHVSEKMKIKLKTYRELRKEYLEKHKYCFANLPGCTKKAVDVHHLGRRGSNLNAEETFMACCRSCHDYLHSRMSAAERRNKNLMI